MRIISSPMETSLISVIHGVADVTEAANGVAGVRAGSVGLAKGLALLSLSSAKTSTSMVVRSSGRSFGHFILFLSNMCRRIVYHSTIPTDSLNDHTLCFLLEVVLLRNGFLLLAHSVLLLFFWFFDQWPILFPSAVVPLRMMHTDPVWG